MLLAEAAVLYPYKWYISMVNDDLYTICRKLYKENLTKGYYVLKNLNNRVDWYELPVGSAICYLDDEILDVIDI